MLINNFLKKLLPKKTAELVPIDKSSIADVLNPKNIKNSTISYQDNNIGNGNIIDKSTTYNYVNLVQQIPESHLTSNNSDSLAEKIKPIEELIVSGLTSKAIEAYNLLLIDNIDKGLSIDDRFTIYNGLLNCYININEDDEKINLLITKIELLGNVKEYYRFLYIQSIYFYNKHDISKAILFNNKALELNNDYLNAILTKIFFDSVSKTIVYKDAVEEIISHPKYTAGTIREIASMKTSLGDISTQYGEYNEAIKYYEEANELEYTVQKELAIGVSYYFLACLNKDENNTIKHNEIDYIAFNKAVEIFNNLYNIKDKELRKILYKQLIPFYFSCLHLTQRSEEIIKISSEAREYIDVTDNDLMRVKIMAELSQGKYNEETIKNFSSEEKLKYKIFNLFDKGKYEDLIGLLRPYQNIWTNDKNLGYVYLDALLRNQNYDEFIAQYKKLIGIEPNNEPIKMLLVSYYDKTNKVPKAKSLLMEILRDSNDSLTFLEACRFLDRVGYDEELGPVLEKVFSGEYKISELDRSEFIRRKFFYLLRQNNIKELYDLYNDLDKLKLNEIYFTKMSIEYYRLKGDVLNVALQLEQLYNLTGNNEYYLRSASYYFRANDLIKAESILKFLSINKLLETPELYMIYSTLEIFNSNYERAFEYAKKAKEFDEHNPKARSHPFFAGISLRCNRTDDWIASMQGYVTDYPNNGWIKVIKITEEDKNGDTKVTKEWEEIYNSRKEGYQTLQNAFRSQQIGISTYIKLTGTDITQVVSSKNYNKQKLKITTGDILEVQNTTQLIHDEILVDSSSLYILSEADLLNLLETFKTVYITYTTIEYLHIILSNVESPVIRAIFVYIEKSINTKYVPVDTAVYLDFQQKDSYLEETIHCASYSYNNNVPFLNTDFTLKESLGSNGEYVVNMVAMLRGIQQKSVDNSNLISNAIFKLKRLDYDFINFNSIDLCNLSLTITSKEEMIEKFEIYLSMDRYSDHNSFVDVFIEFLTAIHSTVSNEVFLEYAEMVIRYIDNYISKSKHYFHLLSIQYPEYREQLLGLIIQNNFINLIHFLNLKQYKFITLDYNEILNSSEFQRAKGIITACTRGVYSFLKIFGQNEDELKFYHQFLKSICVKIDIAMIERLYLILKEQK